MFFIKIQIDKRFNKINDNFIRGIVMRDIKLFFLIFFLLTFKNDAQSLKNEFVVVVDAGHGGKDPGAVSSNNVLEKDITLLIAKELQRTLRDTEGYQAVLIRSDDSTVSLNDRYQNCLLYTSPSPRDQ